jgi:hypothetical protein
MGFAARWCRARSGFGGPCDRKLFFGHWKFFSTLRYMKKIFSLIALVVMCSYAFSQLSCDPTLWPHIYQPERLQGEKKCITVKGVVKTVKAEQDGGYTLQVKLDPGQPLSLLNEKNMSAQNGCLVAVIICAHRPIAQAEAVKSCGVYESKVKVPAVGDHVQVTGTYSLDAEAGHGWNGLYPVSDLIELQKH